jgi:hypothetical protein
MSPTENTATAHNADGNGDENLDKISFRAKPLLINKATQYAKDEGYRGAGAVARKALLAFLVKEGYLTKQEKRRISE